MADNNEIQQFNMDDVKKRMVDQIRATFAAQIPDEAFAKLIDTEVKAFFAPVPSHYSGGQPSPSPFQTLLRKEMEDFIKKLIKEELNKPEWSQWLGADEFGQQKVGEGISNVMKSLAPKMVEAMIQSMVVTVIERMRQGH